MIKPRVFVTGFLLGLALGVTSGQSGTENPLEALAAQRLDHVQNLKLELQGSRLIISGKVKNYFEKRAAERALLKLRGISSVDNRIIVTPIARTDSQIKDDISTALQTQAWLNPRKVAVRVNKNVATLSGAVEHLREKDLVEEIAGSVRGVKDVINEITVQTPGKAPRPDDGIKQGVEAALLAELGETVRKNLSVEVAKGAVVLRGAVRNYYEKKGAYYAAGSVPGVTAVKNLLEIE